LGSGEGLRNLVGGQARAHVALTVRQEGDSDAKLKQLTSGRASFSPQG
jgi:hypothetical protein